MISGITVLSTGLPRVGKRCRESVARQREVGQVEHLCIDVERQTPPRTKLENIVLACLAMPPERVVAVVDGDDWLAIDWALARAVQEHERGAWVTYGSFRHADGRPGFASPVGDVREVRDVPWTATHLKTLRAGLVQAIQPADLRDTAGDWLARCDDMALMLPCLEMAAGRAVYVPDVLYVYDYGVSFEFGATAAQRADEAACAAHIRSKPAYARLATLGPRGAPFEERGTGGPT